MWYQVLVRFGKRAFLTSALRIGVIVSFPITASLARPSLWNHPSSDYAELALNGRKIESLTQGKCQRRGIRDRDSAGSRREYGRVVSTGNETVNQQIRSFIGASVKLNRGNSKSHRLPDAIVDDPERKPDYCNVKAVPVIHVNAGRHKAAVRVLVHAIDGRVYQSEHICPSEEG
jgi:hypothetical protein